ncbi:MAG TPA: uracil-DNA glycosylase [Candidatus Eisenbacteria bacterium]
MAPSSRRPRGDLSDLNARIVACTACPRLIAHCREVARLKRRAWAHETYWGRPVPSFGDPSARLLVVGLAPAAHGGNRTGRVFTGDSSGDWLYDALHRAGFANQPTSTGLEDGLVLTDAWVTATNHCAPPDNKPSLEEQAACRPFLVEEIGRLARVRVVLALGRIAWDGWFRAMADAGHPIPRPRPGFGHGVEVRPFVNEGPLLLGSFHPSRQNTNTGKLTRAMWHAVFARARVLVESD